MLAAAGKKLMPETIHSSMAAWIVRVQYKPRCRRLGLLCHQFSFYIRPHAAGWSAKRRLSVFSFCNNLQDDWLVSVSTHSRACARLSPSLQPSSLMRFSGIKSERAACTASASVLYFVPRSTLFLLPSLPAAHSSVPSQNLLCWVIWMYLLFTL